MKITLKNNRDLIRKSNLFKKRKKHFDIYREDYLLGGKTKIEKKPLKPEELEAIREKTQKDNRRTMLLTLAISIITITALVLISIIVVRNAVRTQKEFDLHQKKIMEAKRIEEMNEKIKEKKEKYEFYIEDGDNWLNKKKYNNAIFQYKYALSTELDNKTAQKRLMLAYTLQCINTNIGCEHTINELENMIEACPTDKELYEMIIDCKEYLNDTTELNRYYIAIKNLP